MLVSKKKYVQLQNKYDIILKQYEEHETKYNQLFESVKVIVDVCRKWNKDQVGNLRAINTIAALFNLDKPKKKFK
tara:strand:- start:267 stop:491 length:225 start_codon:yes stop_codon:yes gene_type:complete